MIRGRSDRLRIEPLEDHLVGMGGDEKGIQFSLVGDSTRTLQELAADIVPILSRGKHLRDVRVDLGDANSELSVRVNRDRGAAFGFSANQVALAESRSSPASAASSTSVPVTAQGHVE